jgi:hypothetical protein
MNLKTPNTTSSPMRKMIPTIHMMALIMASSRIGVRGPVRALVRRCPAHGNPFRT